MSCNGQCRDVAGVCRSAEALIAMLPAFWAKLMKQGESGAQNDLRIKWLADPRPLARAPITG